MTILVTGGSGKVGSEVVRHLLARGVQPRVLLRNSSGAGLPSGAVPVVGDMTDVAAMRSALTGVDTLFLLNAVVPDELTQALTVLNLARDAGIDRFVYLSVLGADAMQDVPHIASKNAVEGAIASLGLSATVLHATYFMQNDLALKDGLTSAGIYPMPIGGKGLATVDVRDLGEVAALELMRRDAAVDRLPADAVTVCGPDVVTGAAAASIWSEALGRPVAYAGDDLDQFEKVMAGQGLPGWMIYEYRLMFRAMQARGQSEVGAADQLSRRLGRPLRTYAALAREAASDWQAGPSSAA